MKKVSIERVLHYFREISQIPRCTRDEKRICEYLINFAKEHGYEYYSDDVYNVVITRPASESYKDKPKYILQGHSDMVCEKTTNSNHDFTKDPIEIIIDGDIMTANETTLGADDGVAVAMVLAILDAKDIELPQIEFLCTSQEEEGMVGAINLADGVLKGDKLINIDSEEWGTIVTACAGGNNFNFEFDLSEKSMASEEMKYYEIDIDKFYGGHSGIEIHKPRVNAIVATFQFLSQFDKVRIAEVKAPGKFNAISRTFNIKFACKEDISTAFDTFVSKCKELEKDGEMALIVHEKPFELLDEKLSSNMISLISEIPNGVYAMSEQLEGMVETSMNVGLMEYVDNKLVVSASIRSSINAKKEELSEICVELAKKYAAKGIPFSDYPAWEFEEKNELLDHVMKVYEDLFKEKPKVEAIHAGLECAILKAKFPEIEMLSIGPDLRDVHTPQEICYISSLEKATDYVMAILQA